MASNSTGDVQGYVKSQINGRPLSGVSLTLNKTRTTNSKGETVKEYPSMEHAIDYFVYTDSNGFYIFKDLPAPMLNTVLWVSPDYTDKATTKAGVVFDRVWQSKYGLGTGNGRDLNGVEIGTIDYVTQFKVNVVPNQVQTLPDMLITPERANASAGVAVKWSDDRKLHINPFKSPVSAQVQWTNPYGAILPGDYPNNPDLENDPKGIPWSQWVDKTPSKVKHQVFPTKSLKYNIRVFCNDTFYSQYMDPWGGNIAKAYFTFDVYIGYNYNTDEEKWDNLIKHHRYQYKMFLLRDALGAGITGSWFEDPAPNITNPNINDLQIYDVVDSEGNATYGGVESSDVVFLDLFPDSQWIEILTDSFNNDKINLLWRETPNTGEAQPLQDGFAFVLGTTRYSFIDPDFQYPSAKEISADFEFPAKYPSNTGIYVDAHMDSSPITNATWLPVLDGCKPTDVMVSVFATPIAAYSNVSYNDVLGFTLCSNDTNEGNVRMFYSTGMHIQEDYSQEDLSKIINAYDETNNIFGEDIILSAKNASTVMIGTGEYIIYYHTTTGICYKNTKWEDGSIVLGEEKLMIPDSSNPVSFYDPLLGVAWIFAWKEDKLFHSGSRDLTNWSAPTAIVEILSLPEQVVSVFQNGAGVTYIVYYDSSRNPTSVGVKLSLLTEAEAAALAG